MFPNEAEAQAAAAKIKAGASFDDIVKERNLKPEDVDLGQIAKDALLDPTEANAVFALPAGGVSGVLPSQFGPVIVRVKSITPSTVKPFAEVAEDIKRQISAARASDKIQALHDKIEDLRVSGKPLPEAAKAVGLTTQSIPAVDASGRDPSGKEVALPDKAELLRAAFASDVGLDEAPIPTKDRGYVWFDVTKVDPSHERSFEEAKPQVEAQWRAEQIDKALAAKADDLVKRIRAGANFADVAKSVGAAGQAGRRHPAGTRRRACRRPWWRRSFASRPTASDRPRRPTAGRCSRSPPTRRRRSRPSIRASSRWPRNSTGRPARAWSINISRRCAGRLACGSTRPSCNPPKAADSDDHDPRLRVF